MSTQQQVPAIQVEHRTVELHQFQFIVRAVGHSSSEQNQVLTARTTRTTVETPQVELLSKILIVVDMPVVVQRKVTIAQIVLATAGGGQQLQFIDKVFGM